MYNPVKSPIATVTMMLIMLTALEPAPIFSFSSDRIRNLLPMKAGTRSFGEIISVASPYIRGWTVGNVDMAPLHTEYGRGQSRIIQRSARPSYLSVRARAANRLSCSIRRFTNPESTVLDTMKEHVEPTTVAVM